MQDRLSRSGHNQVIDQGSVSNQPASIAFVLPGVAAGGSEHVVSMLCDSFAARGCRVTLAAFAEPGARPFYRLDPQVQFRAIGLSSDSTPTRRPLKSALRLLRLRRTLRDIQPDIVISFLTRTNILTLLANPGVPVIVSERNNASMQPLPAIWAWLRRTLYPRASALVTMTAGAMNQLAKFAPPVTRVIPNHASALPARRAALDGQSLVAVGRLVPQKGFDLLLPAFAKAALDHPDWTLTIWGEGDERASLEAQRDALGLRERVFLPGVTETPGGWTTGADLFVLSSRFEGWGLVVGEAMAAGIPTIAFDCEFGPAEMIRHDQSGLLVPAGDVDALATALGRLMGDEKSRRRLGAAGAQAMERLSPQNIVQQWFDLIGQFVAIPRCREEHRDAA